jgi:hypothetical protein
MTGFLNYDATLQSMGPAPRELTKPEALTAAQLATAITAVTQVMQGRLHPAWRIALATGIVAPLFTIASFAFGHYAGPPDDNQSGWFIAAAVISGIAGAVALVATIVITLILCSAQCGDVKKYRAAILAYWENMRETYDARLDADPELFNQVARHVKLPVWIPNS